MNSSRASPPADHQSGFHRQPRNFFDNLMKFVNSIATLLIFAVIVAGVAFCVRGCFLGITQGWRRMCDRALEAQEQRKKKKVVSKNLPPLVEYSTASQRCVACAICLEDFKDGESCQVLPLCNHAFHLACIEPWLIKNLRCPNCRTSITPPYEQC